MESETVSKKDVTLDKNAENSGKKPEVAKEEKPSSANLETKIADLEKQCKELQDKYLLAKADLDNARKRFLKDKEDVRIQTTQFVCLPIITLFDSFKMGLESAQKCNVAQEVLKGFQMILQQFQESLKALGIEEINPQNEAFNPHLHDAVSTCFHETVAEDHIIHVVRVGYKLGDRLLRAASVVVSKGKEVKNG